MLPFTKRGREASASAVFFDVVFARRRRGHPASLTAGLLTLCVATGLGCSEDTPLEPEPTPLPDVGWIVVVASVTGEDLDVDGFAVRVGGGTARTLAPGTAVVFADLAPGLHTVTVEGVASNCVVRDANPQTVAVAAREATAIVFSVTCNAHTTGGIRVWVATPGFRSFGAALGTGTVSFAGADNSVLFSNLLPGTYPVRLQIDAGACTLNEPNPQATTVAVGRVTDVYFSLTCPGGSLVVSVTTTGTNRPSSYTVYVAHVDDSYCYLGTCAVRSVSATGQIRFDQLSLVDYYVTLHNVPRNCTPTPSFQRVMVPIDGQVQASFTVSCQ